ncbi:hypothetical protein PASE110613_17745 [Paenibacillus sediminis]|uniref:Uncharacterized protein n=1 Tax=Paenibacillus sediminis TaxID=664909 RepID=A0ABS4H807_9BACL|nr:hypothetical protein [Paenibacillus sediminis]MBP1938670.1 hypothetical protein [Paenibacillus sediminis]
MALEVIEMAQNDERSDMADIHLVYNIVIEPNLKDAELQKEFGCAEPTNIVGLLFRAGEIGALSESVQKD